LIPLQAKAFDRKTSVLQYLVRLIMSNDTQLLDFRTDLNHVSSAENIILEALISDIKSLEDELTKVLETANAQADKFEAEGRVQPVSIQELKEQKTAVRKIEHVPQYNQMQHLTGRTSMERFALNADHAIKDALELAVSVKESYAKLLDFMCESESMASNDFFGTMRRFANEFDKAREQVEKEEKAKVRGFGIVVFN
jgi:Formin Homology 2 Domain